MQCGMNYYWRRLKASTPYSGYLASGKSAETSDKSLQSFLCCINVEGRSSGEKEAKEQRCL